MSRTDGPEAAILKYLFNEEGRSLPVYVAYRTFRCLVDFEGFTDQQVANAVRGLSRKALIRHEPVKRGDETVYTNRIYRLTPIGRQKAAQRAYAVAH